MSVQSYVSSGRRRDSRPQEAPRDKCQAVAQCILPGTIPNSNDIQKKKTSGRRVKHTAQSKMFKNRGRPAAAGTRTTEPVKRQPPMVTSATDEGPSYRECHRCDQACKGNRHESFPVTVNHYPSTRVCTCELCFLLQRETPFFSQHLYGPFSLYTICRYSCTVVLIVSPLKSIHSVLIYLCDYNNIYY
jgi:hypothetical protein